MPVTVNLREPERCYHCEAVSTVTTVAVHLEKVEEFDSWWAGYNYQLLACSECHEVMLRCFWDYIDYEEEPDGGFYFEYLFPPEGPSGLPAAVAEAYEAARTMRRDPNAYGVLLRRVLEEVCLDRGASGGSLNQKLDKLARRGEFPASLVILAKGLKNLGNVAAHPELGTLTKEEVPILDDLTRAILEYVYRAPALAAYATARYRELRERRKSRARHVS